jgi:membrane-associated protease RseP (regulator of RpoE activity)
MFYKLLGMVVWKFAVGYVRQNYGRQLRVAAALGLIALGVGGYLAARSGE